MKDQSDFRTVDAFMGESSVAGLMSHALATAPEHVAGGCGLELAQLVAEFNADQEVMFQDGNPVTNVFNSPAKREIVRLNNKVRVYQQGHGWMTPQEARERIEQWKDHARAQGSDRQQRNLNSDRVVLSLFDLSGEWSRPWEEAGYQVYRFDIQDDPEVGDVNNFCVDFFGDWFGNFEGVDIYAILAACPCTDFASSGARHFEAKDADGRTAASVRLVHQTLRTIEYFRPVIWAIENPKGRIGKLGGLPHWRLSFDPFHLGDTYTKQTLLWGRFNADLPIAPVEPVEGSKMHTQYGGKSMATKNARSVTPQGFSYGFFMANNAIDHPAMAIAGKFDRLDRHAIERAVKAGVTETEISEAVEDFYYQDLDDDAANEAILTLIAEKGGDMVAASVEAKKVKGAKAKTVKTRLDKILALSDGERAKLQEIGAQKAQLLKQGIDYGTPHYKENRYLRIVKPSRDGARDFVYVGADPVKQGAALEALERGKRYDSLIAKEREIEESLATLESALDRVLWDFGQSVRA